MAIELFAGLHGFGEAAAKVGFRVVGFDLFDMCALTGQPKPHGVQLVIQDVLTLHGSQFKDAAFIWGSPPCQFFSYTAMPWSRAKKLAAEVRADPARLEKELALFRACFRIQREAIEAAGHFIPLVVENVRGAQPWVGKSRWNFGSYYLWGDVPALMPITQSRRMKSKISCVARRFDERVATTPEEAHALHYRMPHNEKETSELEGLCTIAAGASGIKNENGGSWDRSRPSHTTDHSWPVEGFKTSGMNWSNRELRGQDFTRIAGSQAEGQKVGDNNEYRRSGKPSPHFTQPRDIAEGRKGFASRLGESEHAKTSSKYNARKAASAQIAKIPPALARWVARVYYPKTPTP